MMPEANTPTVLERLLDGLLRPLPSRVFLEVRDRRGGKLCCKLTRTAPHIPTRKSGSKSDP